MTVASNTIAATPVHAHFIPGMNDCDSFRVVHCNIFCLNHKEELGLVRGGPAVDLVPWLESLLALRVEVGLVDDALRLAERRFELVQHRSMRILHSWHI
jgi:hypothetical protein